MALPAPWPEQANSWNTYQSVEGIREIDREMSEETAGSEREQFPLKYRGSGLRGIAYERGDVQGHIIKYTNQRHEAHIARRQMIENIPCLVKIHSVDMIQKMPNLWRIEMDEVRTLPDYLKPLATSMRNHFNYDEDEPDAFTPEEIIFVPQYMQFIKCLQKHAITIKDAHGGNIGYDSDGNLVLFDLGK